MPNRNTMMGPLLSFTLRWTTTSAQCLVRAFKDWFSPSCGMRARTCRLLGVTWIAFWIRVPFGSLL